MSDETLSLRCCVTGGGPAGMMAGFLLARAGIDVVVLEKHADFFRDFRGDTIHPSTLGLMEQLGLLDEFLKIPHAELSRLTGRIGDTQVTLADFSHLPGPCQFIAFMPQWDFLTFVAGQARRYPAFRLEMETEAVDLVYDGDRVAGVRVKTPAGERTVRAGLTIAADGRNSTLRERAGLVVEDIGAPIDVLWMRISRKPDDPPQDLGNISPGGVLIAINRDTYYQCAFVIHKGGFDELRALGIDNLRERFAHLAPFLRDRVAEIKSWDDVSLLTVAVNRLHTWYRPGLLCLGDAAHAMSPIGGVGINLAIQDAVAAANLLYEPLRSGVPSVAQLGAVQARREPPTRKTQAMQVFVQRRVLSTVLDSKERAIALPWPLRRLLSLPSIQRYVARTIGLGFRPERIETPAVTP